MLYICGVARNCAEYLPKVLSNMHQLGAENGEYKIIIMADPDPADKDNSTIAILKTHADIHRDHVILYVSSGTISHIRTINIARARNICLEIMRRLKPAPTDLFIMMDCDNVCSGTINMAVFNKAIALRDQWDAVSFMGSPYYDIWALSIPPFVTSYSQFQYGKIVWESHLIRQCAKYATGELIPALSAFNGIAIYKIDPFLTRNCFYDGTTTRAVLLLPPKLIAASNKAATAANLKPQPSSLIEKGDCEHRHFHFMSVFKYGAKIRILNQDLWA